MEKFNHQEKTQIGDSHSVPDGEIIDADVQLGSSLPTEIGRYRVLRVLGQGGFGTVLLAEDQQLNRQVAIKLPHRDTLSSNAASYLKEAQMICLRMHLSLTVRRRREQSVISWRMTIWWPRCEAG